MLRPGEEYKEEIGITSRRETLTSLCRENYLNHGVEFAARETAANYLSRELQVCMEIWDRGK